MASAYTPPKKVRLACRRCRTRRIKCDGQSPACTNCAKAGEVCLDVDSQNSNVTIPRNFAGAARARIEWLENIIRQRLPDVDLASGPTTGAYPEAAGASVGDTEPSGGDASPSQRDRRNGSARRASLKRPAESLSEQADLESERAQLITASLGMLSLNGDSSQKHYLGASSGLLFANLIRASPAPGGESVTPERGLHSAAQSVTGYWEGEASSEDIMRERYLSLLSILRQELPCKRDAMILVQTYIRSIHMDYPVLELGSIYSALDALYTSAALPTDNDPLPGGWPMSLEPFRWNGRQVNPLATDGSVVPMPTIAYIIFMIFNVAAIVKVRSRVYEYPPERFYRAARLFSNDCFAEISLSSIQALVVLISQCMLTPGEANLWTLVHVALAHCVELGIHREPSTVDQEDVAHQQIRRFLFFTVYGLDRSIASIQGRPLGLRDENFDVQLPEPQSPDQGDSGPIPPSFSAAVTRFSTYYFQLDRVISEIKLRFYHLPRDDEESSWFGWPRDPQSHQTRINQALEKWHDAVECEAFDFSGLDDQQRRIWKAKLRVRYHKTVTLLHQPSQAIRSPTAQSLQKCFDNASCVLREYQNLHDTRGFQQGWRAVHNIFAAGATVIYSFWTSEMVRRNASMEHLSRSLRICSNLLALGGEWWPSVKNGLGNFGAVADLTIRKLHTDGGGPAKIARVSQPLQGAIFEDHRESVDLHLPGLVTGEEKLLDISHVTGPHAGASSAHPTDLQQQPALEDGYADSQSAWPPLYHGPDIDTMDNDLDPEVGSFLANFDNADFTWSLSLDNFGQPYDA